MKFKDLKFYNKKVYAWFTLYLIISFIYFTYKSILSVYAIYPIWLFISSIILFPITFFLIPILLFFIENYSKLIELQIYYFYIPFIIRLLVLRK